MRRRSQITRDLRSPKYRPRVVRSRKLYTRRKKHNGTISRNDISASVATYTDRG